MTVPAALGVDGLPHGDRAALAVAGVVTAELVLPGGAAGGLLGRVQSAVAATEALLDGYPAELRLLCVDSGDDGSDLSEISDWLGERGIALIVLDPAELSPFPRLPPEAGSGSRARGAALW